MWAKPGDWSIIDARLLVPVCADSNRWFDWLDAPRARFRCRCVYVWAFHGSGWSSGYVVCFSGGLLKKFRERAVFRCRAQISTFSVDAPRGMDVPFQGHCHLIDFSFWMLLGCSLVVCSPENMLKWYFVLKFNLFNHSCTALAIAY